MSVLEGGAQGMNLPFTSNEFLNVFAVYNTAVWPAQVALNLLSVAALCLVWKNSTGKVVVYILAILWAWIGVVYHLLFFTVINDAAYVFGVVFIMQAILFMVAAHRMTFGLGSALRDIVAWILIIYGLLLYPLLSVLFGHAYPRMPTFGLPCPTTIFTFGVLLLSRTRPPWYLLVIPVIWSVIGTSAAVSMGIYQDYGLLIAAILAVMVREKQTSVVA
jgi:hypothetical protein